MVSAWTRGGLEEEGQQMKATGAAAQSQGHRCPSLNPPPTLPQLIPLLKTPQLSCREKCANKVTSGAGMEQP